MPLTKEYNAAQSFTAHPLFTKKYASNTPRQMIEKFYTNIFDSTGDTAGKYPQLAQSEHSMSQTDDDLFGLNMNDDTLKFNF